MRSPSHLQDESPDERLGTLLELGELPDARVLQPDGTAALLRELRDLLIDTPVEGSSVLFKSVNELGRQIAGVENHDPERGQFAYYRREKQAINALHQIFQRERPLGDDVRIPLLQLIDSQLSQTRGLKDEWMERIGRLVRSLEIAKRIPSNLDDQAYFHETLSHCLGVAMEHFIIHPVSGERVTAFHSFIHRVYGRLRLNGPSSDPWCVYTVCDPDPEKCRARWRRIFRSMTGDVRQTVTTIEIRESPEAAADTLIDLEQRNMLRMFAVPPSISANPLLVFNPSDERPIGFQTWVRDGTLRLIPLPEERTYDIRKQIYEPLIHHNAFTRVRFSDMREELISASSRLPKD